MSLNEITTTSLPLAEIEADLLIVPYPISATGDPGKLAGSIDPAVGMAAADISGEFGQMRTLYPSVLPADRVCLLGVGQTLALSREKAARLGSSGARCARSYQVLRVAILVPEDVDDVVSFVHGFTEGFILGSYQFSRYKTVVEPENEKHLGLTFVTSEGRSELVAKTAQEAEIIAQATAFARDLGNMSPGDLTAEKLSEEARASASKYGYACTVWGKDELVVEGMGGILAVNGGSLDPPSFAILEWDPEDATTEQTVVLVGKGVVFDTGGLSLKPTKNSMDQMKFDMAGAAAVIGAMEAIARLEIPIHVVGLVPATDNRPGVRAYMPSEVVTMHSGLTVEVLNTDAEGRMLLADALSYAKRYNPDLVVDIATLTGAQVVALGTLAAAMMTNEIAGESDRKDLLTKAGEATGDCVAPMPMFDAYAKMLESDVADLKNVGGREASSITAAKFLERFTSYPWVHLDIAGPAAIEKPDGYRVKGATGFGVRLLIDVVARLAMTGSRAE